MEEDSLSFRDLTAMFLLSNLQFGPRSHLALCLRKESPLLLSSGREMDVRREPQSILSYSYFSDFTYYMQSRTKAQGQLKHGNVCREGKGEQRSWRYPARKADCSQMQIFHMLLQPSSLQIEDTTKTCISFFHIPPLTLIFTSLIQKSILSGSMI